MTIVKFKNQGNAEPMPFMPSIFGNLFNDFMHGDLIEKNVFKSIPAVNISEKPEKFIVELAVPGMKKDDFKVEIENRLLTIRAEKKEEKKDENHRYTRKEFSYSSFSRSFTMPEDVSADNISAEYTNGILMLHLPKKEDAKQKPSREIKVS